MAINFIRTLIIVFYISLCSIMCAAQEEVEPMLDAGQPMWVACVKEGAELKDAPGRQSAVITHISWMTPYVVIEKSDDQKWIKVGEYIRTDAAKSVGWMNKSDLLMRQESRKKNGIYEKSIVVVHYDKERKVIGGAVAYDAPQENANKIGQELTLFQILHVYDERTDVKADRTFLLLGDEPNILDPQKPQQTIQGWIDKTNLFKWDTRQAAEYDKSTVGERDKIRIYAFEDELRDLLLGKSNPADIEPLAEETDKAAMRHTDPRFPIITKERQVGEDVLWHIGFVSDEIGGAGSSRVALRKVTRLPNQVDIFFVFDGTGSMENFKEAIIAAVREVQSAATEYWQENYPGERKASIRYSIAMYKDYTETEYYKRIPLEDGNIDKINLLLETHNYAGGLDEPAVFNGIISAIKDGSIEMRDASFRAVVLIGDMGNLGTSNEPDPNGHTIEDIMGMLKTNNCDFYAIHTASDSELESHARFEREAKTIMDALPQGYADYIPLTSPGRVKVEIYDKIIGLLDERYRVVQELEEIAEGRKFIGGDQISGTKLTSRAVDIMKRHKINPDDFARKGATPFAEGWVTPFEQATGTRMMKLAILMNKHEVEMLISLLGRLTIAKPDTIRTAWIQALEDFTGDTVDSKDKESVYDNMVPAEVINSHLGLSVRSGILNMTMKEIAKLPQARITEETRILRSKLYLLRAVINEKKMKEGTDEDGEIIYNIIGDKQYWFGTRGNELVWLDAETDLP